MPEYKINAVDKEAPREWNGPNGTVYYITVGLEGQERPVSIGKKTPDALKVGDTVHGTILPNPDFPTDKWKPEQNPEYAGKPAYSGPKRGSGYTRDDSAIKAQWAIGQAVQLEILASKDNPQYKVLFGHIEDTAKELFTMVDRVKNSVVTEPENKPEQSALEALAGGQ